MSKQSKIKVSAIRQKIIFIRQMIDQHLERILNSNTVTKGTICEKRRKCGHARCKCAHGDLHVTKILSYSHRGRSRIIHLSKYSEAEYRRLEKQVKEYQKFRSSRGKIVYYFKLLIKEINKMEQNILIEAAPSEKGGDNNSAGKKD